MHINMQNTDVPSEEKIYKAVHKSYSMFRNY